MSVPSILLQIRTGSSRLPNKALYEIIGKSMSYWVVYRALKSGLPLILVTTTLPQDDILEDCAKQWGIECFRHEKANTNDVLGLFVECCNKYKLDKIVRLTGDNPMVDGDAINLIVSCSNGYDYTGNCELPLTFPYGLAVEVIESEALRIADKECIDPLARSNVTQYVRQHPNRFRIQPIYNERDLSSLRWTVDTKTDLDNVRKIFEYFGDGDFSWREAVNV